MSENSIKALLDGVARTGEIPDDDAIREAVTKYSSRAERTEVARQVRMAAKRIVAALDSGLPAQAAEHADSVAEAYAAHTPAGADPVTLPERTLQGHVDPAGRISDGSKRVMSLLEAAAAGAALGPKDLENVLADAHDAPAARAAIEEAADEVRRVHATGQLGAARALSKQHGLALGDLIADRLPSDPYDGVDDPRQLADLLPRSGVRG